MNDLEYESTLVDRIAKIQAINEQYDLLQKALQILDNEIVWEEA